MVAMKDSLQAINHVLIGSRGGRLRIPFYCFEGKKDTKDQLQQAGRTKQPLF